ncbi:HEAT repeat domain-containing protein [Halocatena halophila]|uniref:HEAT repeat domain-containing protein n=1 Tax=Halocatena halophila TaxID=2814576 RepID=UPI002ED01B83
MADLADETLLHRHPDPRQPSHGGSGEPDYVPEGFFEAHPDESPITDAAGWPLLNPKDLVKTTLNQDILRGCCGPDGQQGPNTDCRNGHTVGIEMGDCYTVHCVALDPAAVIATETEAVVTEGIDEKTPSDWLSIAENGSVSDRRRAIVLLGIHDIREAIPMLSEIILNGPQSLCGAGTQALYRLPSVDAVPALESALHESDPSIRERGAKALGEIEHRQAVEPLLERLIIESDPSVCHEIKRSIYDGATFEQLQNAFQAAETVPGQKAILWLFEVVRGDEVVDTLVDITTDPAIEPSVRKKAVWQLTVIASNDDDSPLLSATEYNRLLFDMIEAIEHTAVKIKCLETLSHREIRTEQLQSRRDDLFRTLRDDLSVDSDVRSTAQGYFEQESDHYSQ